MIDQRQQISDALDQTLLVEAAAGTGKTTALVARVVRLLASGRARLTEIAALTFSEKAAGELKLRLRQELEAARLREKVGSGARVCLERSIEDFEAAHVSTIHGFCAELLRERPVEACIDPAFQVLTEARSLRLFDEAFAEWMQRTLQSPPEGVRRSLRRVRTFSWRAPGRQDEGPVQRLRSAGRELLQWRDHPAAWTRPLWNREQTIDEVLTAVLLFAERTRDPLSDRDALFTDTRAIRRLADELQREADADRRDYDAIESLLVQVASEREWRNTRRGYGTMYSREESRDAVLTARAGLREALQHFRDLADADLAALVHRELQPCLRAYESRKQRAGALDFLDLLIRARDLVRDCQPVRVALQRRFRYVLVDEFQDTDSLQAELLTLLTADEAGDGRIRPGALFVVGDPKQSIYRFRRADIAMYQRVCNTLAREHATRAVLQRSFRSVRSIQLCVNNAFAPLLQHDDHSLQAGYVPLGKVRDDIPGQPAVVALPVARPYGSWKIAHKAIEASLPGSVGEFVRWLVQTSDWRVSEPDGQLRKVAASDICLLFKRFTNYGEDVTRPYLDALEARGLPHLLVGGKTFYEREEVDALRTALSAIEWPEDELSVFATLRGPLFAIGDQDLLEYHARQRAEARAHAFHPYRLARDLPEHLTPIGEALTTLRSLHAGRNYRPVADTIGRLLHATRAQASFMLWQSGEQVLANVLQVGELARQYELDDGLSFRGFVELLQEAAEGAQTAEAPILEEGSAGVRLMTVHKAKGLEFPVVILADPTCRQSRSDASRYVDSSRGLCAMTIAGWTPLDVREHNADEVLRDAAEGVRVAYVAATRARDLLVIPAIGDRPLDDSWVAPLSSAIYPPPAARTAPDTVEGLPTFRGHDTVLQRPDDGPPDDTTVRPGAYRLSDSVSGEHYTVVWWDPLLLDTAIENTHGIRREDLVSKTADASAVREDRVRYEQWRERRLARGHAASRPTLQVVSATEHVASALPGDEAQDAAQRGDRDDVPEPTLPLFDISPQSLPTTFDVVVLNASAAQARPSGRRFGILVHALLAAVPLTATRDEVGDLAAVQARMLAVPDDERDHAVIVVVQALRHQVFDTAKRALAAGRACRREVPITIRRGNVLIDGQIDLAVEDEEGWLVVDFKTDAELGRAEDKYRRQVALYAEALATITGSPSRGIILRV